jgi:DNA repair exonuclease SbcCD ATPase subunit|tara:strand:- start:200 stop:1861 length:1662 start_codon:yes stop_codon:yes gene_type:complete
MILFKNLTYKNFLSTGNNPITIQLNTSPTTLIVGTNGAGKSTILDAISFALFGKPHRNVKRGGLVNSVNGKNCEVDIEFETAGHEWRVHRGIKPNNFEVYQDGNMIDQQTNVRDYQKFLEQNILKLNHKSFHQIVVLGSSSFIPFMQLKAWDRRDVIEDLLDIGVFSKMKTVLKQRNSVSRDTAKTSKISLDAQKDKIEYQKRHITELEKINTQAKQSFDDEIQTTYDKIQELTTELNAFPDGLSTELETLRGVKDKLNTDKGRCNHDMNELVSKAKFFEGNDECPTCTQEITDALKTSMLNTVKAGAKKTSKEITDITDQYDTTIESLESIRKQVNSMKDLGTNIAQHNQQYNTLQQKQVQEVDVTKPNADLLTMQNDADDLREDLDKASDELLYNDIAGEMLKDTGIRTKIIKEYLPAMNTLINKYLQVLEFFVAFNLDENFQESIKSRHRDDFVYDNFSEGEKMRIDLSLLFAWRQIAKMKNSTNTNLLILDETFDSSLDEEGVDNLMKILFTLDKGTNTFIISHKPDILESKLKAKIEFKKINNFSALV